MEKPSYELPSQKPKTVMERVEEMAFGMVQSQKPEYVKKYSEDIKEMIRVKEDELKAAWERAILEGRVPLDPEEDEKWKAKSLASQIIKEITDKKYHN